MPAEDSPAAATAASRLLAMALEIVQTRLELAAVELSEERVRLAQQTLGASIALFTLGVGIVLGVVTLVWASAAESRVAVLAIATAAFLLVGGLACARWRWLQRQRRPLLQDSLTMLRADVAALRATPARETRVDA